MCLRSFATIASKGISVPIINFSNVSRDVHVAEIDCHECPQRHMRERKSARGRFDGSQSVRNLALVQRSGRGKNGNSMPNVNEQSAGQFKFKSGQEAL